MTDTRDFLGTTRSRDEYRSFQEEMTAKALAALTYVDRP
jgi:hypothetical protein